MRPLLQLLDHDGDMWMSKKKFKNIDTFFLVVLFCIGQLLTIEL